MAKTIIGGLLYDTEKAKKIFTFRRKVKAFDIASMPGYCYAPFHDFEMYKTKSGRFFEFDTDAEKIAAISGETAEGIIKALDPDTYMKIFKVKIQEA